MVKKKSYKETFCPNKHKCGCKSFVKIYNDGITPNEESAHNKLCKTRSKRAYEKSHNGNVESKVMKCIKIDFKRKTNTRIYERRSRREP